MKRHLTRLSCAEREVISYMERGDIEAVQQFAHGGFHVLKSMAQATAQRGLRHRVIFGFSDRNAPGLLAFLKAQAQHLQRAGLCRFTGEMGHPFHVMDGETVILGLDHPFVPEGRFASLLIRDEVLAGKLTEGFKGLWDRAMEDMGEIRHWPGALRDRA